MRRFINNYFMTDELSFESRILNLICIVGATAGTLAIILRSVSGLPSVTIVPLLFIVISMMSVFFISGRGTANAEMWTTIIVYAVSILFWPLLFFTIGGPNSGMAVYFAFAIILDFILLNGKMRVLAVVITCVIMVSCYFATLYAGVVTWPQGGLNRFQWLVDTMQSILIVGFFVGGIVLFQTYLYKNEKKKAEIANMRRDESIMQLELAQITVSAMFEANPHINILFDSNFNVIDCNPAAVNFAGFKTKQELLGGFMELMKVSIPPFQPNGAKSFSLLDRFKIVLAEGATSFETNMILGDVERTLAVDLKKIPYEKSFAIVGYIYDMTNIHKREMELKRARELNETRLEKLNLAVQALETAQHTVSAMFDSNPHINILFDSDFKAIGCNPAAVKFMGFETKEELYEGLEGRLAEYVPEFLSTGKKTSISDCFSVAWRDGFIKLETEFIANTVARCVDVELKKIPYGDGFAIVGYLLDMTEMREREMELKRRDQQLSEAVEEARAANRAKSAFLSTMSHEIRTPMNAILGITEIQLQNKALSPDVGEALGKIYASGDMLLGIINDILDLSKIEAGKLELINDRYEIASLISDTVQLNMMRIGSKPIDFELDIDEDAPEVLLGDELRVKQVLNNILSNAFKYTAAGKVTMSVHPEKDLADESVMLVFKISDTGQGMTKEQINSLFDEYSRFNMKANRTTEGTGLGMSITQKLIGMMNGEIFVESEQGKGSVFTIHLPQGKMGDGVLGKEMAENLKQFRTSSRAQMRRVQITREPMPYGRVLIVDDVETNIYVARGLLAPYGLQIESVSSGLLAIEKIKAGKLYDVIFMDHMMPQMDGIEATHIIRNMGYERAVVALTANAVAGQAELFIGNGFDDFISKPIDVRQLNSALNKFIRDKQPQEVIEAARRESEHEESKIGENAMPSVDARFAEIFARDAGKSIRELSEICAKGEKGIAEDIRTYTIHVHGMKSALANLGNMELSAVARSLEVSARENDIKTIFANTQAFINSLSDFVSAIVPAAKSNEAVASNETGAGEDTVYLREKLCYVKEACENYNKKSAREIIADLKEKKWAQPAEELLDAISEYLLHSDFDEIAAAIDRFTAG